MKYLIITALIVIFAQNALADELAYENAEFIESSVAVGKGNCFGFRF